MSALAGNGSRRDDAGAALAGFMLIGLLAGVSNGIAKVSLPLFAAHLHADALEIGLVSALQSVGLLLLSLPIGGLLDRVGARRLFQFGGLGGAFVYALLFPAASVPRQLMICVLLFGLLNPFRMVTTQAEFLALVPRLKHWKAGWNRAAHSSGMFFIGPTVGALLLTTVGFSTTFELAALGLLVTVLIGNRVLSGTGHHRSAPALSLREKVCVVAREMAVRRTLRSSLLVEFTGQVAVSYFTAFIVLVGTREVGMSTQGAAALITLQGGCFVATLVLWSAAIAPLRGSARYVISAAMLVTGEAALMAPQGPLFLSIGAILLGIGVAIQHLTNVHQFGALVHELGRGRVGGIFTIAGPCGGIVGAGAGGLVAQALGMTAGFRLMFVVFAVQLALALRRHLRETAAATGAAHDRA